MKQSQLIVIAILFVIVAALQSNAQTNIPLNTVVSQNFNGIGSSATASLPANWKMSSAGTGAASGWATGTNITATTQAANSGTPTTGGAYNWATTAGTDRAVGFMTNGYASPNSVMAFYRNTTGATVTSITINFAIERYRVNTSTFSLSFFSSTDGTAWTARTAGDIGTSLFATGASSYTFGSPQIVYKTVTITGLSISNNGDFYLRWLFTNTGNTNSQGLGLDDVSLYAGTATPVIIAQLRDALTIDNPPLGQANPGDQLTYTDVIKNTGSGDANGVVLTDPAPTNTTYNPGSLKTSSLARDDSYTTPLNTALNIAAAGVLTNDFGMPAPTVLSFGPSANSAATAAGGAGSSDNGGTLTVNADGSFTYTPPAGFTGNDKFAYLAGNGNLPNNDGYVSIAIGTAPTAANDAYNVIGNVSISPNVAQGVLANDGGTGITVTAVNGSAANVGTGITTTGGGNLTVNADGSFTYNPLAGFDGPTDNFTYTIDNGFSSPSTATVTLNISGMVWFINAAAGAGDGRLSTPFNTLAAFQALNNGAGNNPAINDYIFIYENAAAYTGPITLLNGQKLIGQDATASLSTITGLTPAAYSTAFPVMNTGAPVTTLSTTVAATNAVNLNSAAGTNLLRGFTVGNTTGSGISGTSFGTLTILDVSKNGTGQALALTTGAFAAGATLDNITTTSSGTAVSLTTITGTLIVTTGAINGATGTAFNVSGGTVSVTYSGGITQSNNAAMVSITNHATGTITFNTGTLSATSGTGLQFDNADGTYNFNGTTTLNGGDAGIDILNGSAGTFSFTSGTSITNPSGTAFNIGGTSNTCGITYSGAITKNNAGSMVSITNHASGTVTFQTGTLSATNGTGLQFDNADGTYNFNGTTTMNGGDAGIDILNGSAGTFTFGTGTSITSPSGIAFNISGTASTCAVTYSGGITQINNAAMVSIAGGHSTGTITFQTGTLGATNGTGLQFDNADGTYNFNGTTTLNGGDAGIDILNGSGGTFSFTSGTAITNPSGIAINIDNSPGGNITYTGTFSKTNTGVGIQINNKTGGTVAFNGASTKTLSTTTSTAINLTSNTGATINFSGNNLLLTTTSGTGFNATGGTISVTGTGNTITSTTGTALNVASTTIGASNLNFQSINKNGGSTSAIILNTTGSGQLIISGTGTTAGSGGTIENIVGADAISLNTTSGLITLKNMIIEDITAANDATAAHNTRSGVDAISGLTVNGGLTLDNTTIRRISDNAILGGTNGVPDVFTVWNGLTITNCTIEDANRFNVSGKGDANSEGVVRILGITGTVNVTGSTFQRGAEFLDFYVNAGTLTMTVTNSQFLSAYKEFVAGDLSPLASVGLHGIDVTVQGTSNAIVTIGDRNNAALGNTFLNNRLASVRVGNDPGATGNIDVTIGRNTFTVNDHSSGVSCNPGCASADFDFPQGGVLMISRGTNTATWDVIIDRNYFDEVTNASGAVGQLSFDMSRGVWQALVTNNTFDTPGNAPWFIRAELNTTTAKVRFLNNTGIRGSFCSTDASAAGGGCNLGAGQLCPGAAGYCGPGLRCLADIQNGGLLDLTIDGDDFAKHDNGFDPGQTVEARVLNVGAAGTMNVHFVNNTAPDGYSVENQHAGGIFNLFKGASGSAVPATIIRDNNNLGGAGVATTFPPFVNTFGTITASMTAPLLPSL